MLNIVSEKSAECGSVSIGCTRHKIGVNTKFKNKDGFTQLSDSKAWQNVEFTIGELSEHIGKGHPWMPATLGVGTRRLQENANYAEVLSLDIDNAAPGPKDSEGKATKVYLEELTIEQALDHPFIKAHCGLVQPSASHKPGWDKFRLVFVLPRPLEAHENIRACNLYLASSHCVGAADPQCKDASRFYFGAIGSVPALMQEVTLPESFIDDALAWHEGIVAEEKQRAEAAAKHWDDYRAGCSSDDADALLMTALGAINVSSITRDQWIGIGMALAGMGEQWFSVWDSWSATDPRYKPHEMQSKWKSFRGKEPSPGVVFSLAKQFGFKFPKREYTPEEKRAYAKLKAEERRMAGLNGDSATLNVVSIATGNPIAPIDNLESEIGKILDSNLSGAKLQAAKIKLRQGSTVSEREFNQLWESVESAQDEDDKNPDEVRKLLRAKQSSLALESVLSPKIAGPLGLIATMQNMRPEVYLIALLTAIGSLAKNGTTLTMHKGLNFVVSPNLYGAIVAEASQKKSPVVNSVVTRPLKVLNREAKQAHQAAVAAWRERQREATNNGEPFHEMEPGREIFYFTNTSGEAILAQVERCPQRGLLHLSDELAGAFKSRNQYRSGRGSDTEDTLSYYDGSGGLTLRAAGVKNDVGCLNYGMLGAIQPRVLERFLGECEDDNGSWARFIFVSQPLAASTLPDDFDSWDISEMLTDYYRAIAAFEPEQYRLSGEAFSKFQSLQNELEQRRVNEPNPALRAMIGKTGGRIGKLALCLHLVEAAVLGAVPAVEVSADTIIKAAVIAEFAIEQIRAIYSECNPEDRQNPVMAKIVELSRRKGAVSARDVAMALPKQRRAKTAEIRSMFVELVAEGFGTVAGEGSAITFTATSEQRQPKPEAIEPVPEQPELQPGDQVVLVDHGYTSQGLPSGQHLTVQAIGLSIPTPELPQSIPFAAAVDATGKVHSIWIQHLQREAS
jgi:Protein of unknown function (DUF3987)/Primase C terminal 2 (PriCT-2)